MHSLWQKVFGNDHPVEIEIGPERGTFLLATAARNPDRNYLGIERSAARARRMEAALLRRRLANARFLHADARCVLRHCVPPESVAAYHVYFPDPWWKRRHHRRRLLTPSFAALLSRTLAAGGLVHLVTDVEETFLLGCASLDAAGVLSSLGPPPARPVRTAFEEKALQHGRQIHAVTYRKTGKTSAAS